MSALVDAGPLLEATTGAVELRTLTRRALHAEASPLLTSEACLTEAMYLAGQRGGIYAQRVLLGLVLERPIAVHCSEARLARIRELMTKYQDLPMDFADATLVGLADELAINRIITTDFRDFSVYRLSTGRPFTIVGLS